MRQTTGEAAALFLQRGNKLDASGAPCGSNPEDYSGEHSHASGKKQHGTAQRTGEPARDAIGGSKTDQCVANPTGDEETDQGTETREQARLNHQLAHEASPAGSQG